MIVKDLSELQRRLSFLPGYCNHESSDVVAVLGTGEALYSVGKCTDEEYQAFVVVAEAIIRNHPVNED